MITTELIDRLIRFDGGGLPVVSLYAGIDVDIRDRTSVRAHLESLLKEVRPLAHDSSLSHDARLSLRGDLERILTDPELQPHDPGTLAIFACGGAGLFETVRLPRKLQDRVMVDRTPYLRPTLAVLDEYHRTCVVVLERKVARVWELYLDEIREVDTIRDVALRKPDYAGWYGLEEYRVRNKADHLTKHHYRRVVGRLGQLFRAGHYELLVVGGHDEDLTQFLAFLPKHLRPAVVGTFGVDADTATVADIRQHAERLVADYERNAERELVAGIMDRAAAGGWAVLGPARALWAGSVAAVDTLAIQHGAVLEGVVCDESGWLALSGHTCPFCGKPTRRTADVLDELAETVIAESGTVEHVQADTPLTEHIVAASLRFPLPPQPEQS